jgi:hypothetical protein
VAQVKLMRMGEAGNGSLDCASELAAWDEATAASSGQLRAQAEPELDETGACEVPAGAGYRGLENQLYRVEVHSVESEDEINFKWSRENGSVVVRWDKQEGNKLTVSSAGRDDVLGFVPDDWIELTDDGRGLRGEAGLLVQVIKVDGRALTIDPKGQTVNIADFEPTRKVRRWDMPADTGLFTVDLAETDNWIDLEKGVQVSFEPGVYHVGDYWLIPARTVTRNVEWPRAGNDPLPQLPQGIHHRYCRLAVVDFDGSAWTRIHDCRKLFPPLTEMIRFVYVSGDGQETLPTRALTWPLRVGVLNGQTPVVGAVVAFRISSGNGRLRAWDPAVPTCTGFTAGGATSVEVATGADGMAACCWRPQAGVWQQQVEARLLAVDGKPLVDDDGNPLLTPILFNANLSLASQVHYDSGSCVDPNQPDTVQEALDDLCRNWALHYVGGDGQEARAGEELPQPLQVRVANGRWPIQGAKVAFEITQGDGSLDLSEVEADVAGLAACRWTLGTDDDQRVEAYLVDGERALFVGFSASVTTAEEEPGVRIEDVRVQATREVLANDGEVTLDDVAKGGIVVLCDRAIQPETTSRPTCFVTLEFPMITRIGDQPARLVGYYPFVLASKVDTDAQRIRWRMVSNAAEWLQVQFDSFAEQGIDRLLARLILKGNFIWARERPGLYLDGNAVGLPPGVSPTNLALPSGDGKRGGDFEMWFWLTREPGQVAPGLGVIPNANSDVVKDPRTDAMISLGMRRDALQELLPQGYVVDLAEEFEPEEAAMLADEIGIRGTTVTVVVGQSLLRATQSIQEDLAEHDVVSLKVSAVADADLMAALATRLAAGDAPDIVIGSDALRTELAQAYPAYFGERFIRF